ncbi:hypothetical protein SPC_2980 [Salmonella enterica subsp. enterica serovar Paratyphi C str. RKS4594]|uniref:Uncharacterized protein n=1 Tax=Salmonella paratyphi C (strain RKS4594) TaxID=476213 RepID=C0PXB4_SALPC|nr:hypothetical protein SPC_2980 [Salmonella enterica subsp. enterica serovar Paratyphi C str. RKS4594]
MFPAPAGINRLQYHVKLYKNSAPRASGDKPIEKLAINKARQCSPRQRG